MTRKLTFLILALFALISGPGAKAWGQTTASVELCTSWDKTLAYNTPYTHDYTIDNLNGSTTTMTLGVLGVYRQSNANTYFQMNKKDGYFKNTTKLPGKITKIETTWSAAKGPTKCYFATNAEATSEDETVTVTAAISVTYTPPTDADYYFFNIDVKTGSGSAQMTSCKVYYEAKPSHTLTFSATNGSISAMNGSTQITFGDDVEEGATLDITATADDWYKFSDWNVSGTGSTLGSTTENPTTFTMGTADATLTATFAACVVTVSSNDENWGIALYDDESHTISTAAEDDYRISTTAPYTINPANAATLTAGEDGEYIVSGVKDQDVEITINFEAIPTATYTVFFDGNDHGTPASESITEEEAGDGVTLPDCTPNTGFVFKGWATTNIATEADAGVAGETYYPTTVITLYAVYNEVYTINYMVNGTNPNPQVDVEEGTTLVFPEVSAPDADHVFRGWVTEAIEGTTDTEPAYVNTTDLTATQNITYYAVFAERNGSEPAEQKTQTLQYDTWTYYGSTTDKDTYRLFHSGSYIESAEFDLSKLTKVIVYGGTFGGGSNNSLTIGDGTNTWKSVTVSGSSQTGTNTYTDGTPLSGTGKLRITSNSGTATGSGVRISKVEIFTMEGGYTYSNFCTTIETKTLESIELSGEYPTGFWKGETFSHEGMTVTAHYDDESTKDVTSSATFSTPDMATVGEQEVTVTYEGKTATYNITVKNIANTQETAYTTAEAIDLIDANPAELTTTKVYVKGTVSKVDSYNSQYKSITYWLDNNAFEVYSGKNLNNTDFTSKDDVKVGDDVIIYGKIKKWNSTYEFDAGNYLVSHIKASTLSIDDITVEIGGTITPNITTNVPEYTIAYSVASEDVVKVQDGNLVTVAVGGPVEVTATLTAEGYKEATTTFEVEVIKTITSIAVKTAPTTTSYKEGDFFDPTGLEITLTYSDATTEDVAYAGNEDQFTFEPSLGTALATENTSVTITYAGKSTTQTISVRALNTYNITWMANGEAVSLTPATVIEGNEIGTLPTPEAEYIPEGFTFAGWSTSMASTNRISETYVANENLNLCAVFAREISNPSVEEAVTIIDGSQLPSTATSTVTDKSYDNHFITFSDGAKCQAVQDGALNYFTEEEAILIGKKGKHIYNQTPFDNITKFEIYANKGASAKVSVGINFSTEAIDSYNADASNTWAATLSALDNVYDASEALPTGAKYFWYQVTNDNNSQVQFRITYQKTTTTTRPEYYTRVYDEDTELASLTVAGPSIILSGKTLTVTDAMSNENHANLLIEDGAQLIQNSSDVKATVLKDITGYDIDGFNIETDRTGYYLVANPTATNANEEEEEYDALDGCTAAFDLYTFDPTKALEWVNKTHTDQKVTFERNVGYLYANAQDMALHFRGYLLPTNGTTSIDLVYYNEGEEGREFPGFNLIGNPYACNATISGDYTFLKIVGDAILPSTGSVAPCEGIFVEATAAKQSVTFTPALPASQANAPSAMSIEVSQNRDNVIDRAIVRFDGANDLHKFMLNPAHTNISLAKNGEEFAAVSASSKSGEMPVNFKAAKNGTYTITVNTENVDAEYLHLIDNMTGMDVDLLSTPSYTFDAKTSDYASRFKLVFGVNNTDSESSDSNFAYMSDGNLVIDNIEGQATLQIVDELGRVISTETVNGSYNKALNLKAGLYIINLNGMTQKIIVKQ